MKERLSTEIELVSNFWDRGKHRGRTWTEGKAQLSSRGLTPLSFPFFLTKGGSLDTAKVSVKS